MNAPHEPLARRATALLEGIASGDDSLVHEYYTLLFGFLVDVARRRGRYLAGQAASGFGAEDSVAKNIQGADLETVAHDAVALALRRAVASASRFDPDRGDGASWAVGALGAAYLDVARDLTGSRRAMIQVPTDKSDDIDRTDARSDPLRVVEARDGLERALSQLTSEERFVIVARLHYGMSYREIAAYLFGDDQKTKQVDLTLQQARKKLQTAHAAWVADG